MQHKWFLPSTLAVLAFILYAQSLFFGYTYLDDDRLVANNFWFIGSSSGITQAFTRDVFLSTTAIYYRPLVTVSLAIDAFFARSPDNLLPFHFSNIMLHGAVVVLLYFFLQKLGYSKRVSFLSSLLFLVHPAFVQAVAWIPGRNDSLLALFLLLSILSFLHFLEKKSWVWLGAGVVTFALALFTKESAAMFPLLILPLVVAWNKKKPAFLYQWVLMMGLLTVYLVWFVARSNVVISSTSFSIVGFIAAFIHNYSAFFVYLGKLIIPIHQSVFPIVNGYSPNLGVFVFAVFVGILFFLRKKRTVFLRATFGLTWFSLFLFPVILFHNEGFALGQDVQLEHRLYVPSIGMLIFLLEVFVYFRNKKWQKLYFTAIGLIIVIFAAKTLVYSRSFISREVFWDQAVKTSPLSAFAHRNRAAMYQLAGNPDQAEFAYQQSLKLHAEEPMVHGNLGLIAYERGDLEQAEQLYLKEIEINPAFSLAYLNLGRLQIDQKRLEEARKNLWTAYLLEPQDTASLRLFIETYKESDPEKFAQLQAKFFK